MTAAELPSARLDEAAWGRANDELIELLRGLIRIPSVNPPAPEAPNGELLAARWIAERLADAGRGTGDEGGSGGGLLGHVSVLVEGLEPPAGIFGPR